MIGAWIRDGFGRGRKARVEDDALLVSHLGVPPMLPQLVRPFRQYLTVDGTSSGSNDMGIDGSGAGDTEFYVPAHPERDRHISVLSFSITTGSQPRMWEFADSNGKLGEGIRFYYTRGIGEEVDIHDAMVDNWDIVRLCLGVPTISTGGLDDAFVVKHVGAAGDFGLIPILHLTQLMPPWGLKLDRGTKQKIAMVIRDDCTDADVFNVIAYGFERFP